MRAISASANNVESRTWPLARIRSFAAPHAVRVTGGDVNEDGIPDLVVAFGPYAGRAGTSILFGKGDGTFLPKRTYGGARRWPQHLVLADFNRDGHLDLMESSVSRDITVRLGNGDGTFGPSHKIVVNSDTALYIGSLAVADYNGDGIPDVAFAISANVGGVPSGYVIMTGRGDGRFTILGHYTHTRDISELATVDLNQDGLPDLALTDQFGTTFFLNDGTGMFVNGGSFGVPATATTLADLNGDAFVRRFSSILSSSVVRTPTIAFISAGFSGATMGNLRRAPSGTYCCVVPRDNSLIRC